MRPAAIVIAAWLLIFSAVAFGVIVGIALAPRVSAATLRSATVIPAAPSSLPTDMAAGESATAEPDQWRTAGSPAGAAASVRRAEGLPRRWQTRSALITAAEPTPYPTSRARAVSQRAGVASWYPIPGLVAAVPGWRWGDAPYRLRVCAGLRCVVVTVGDWCGCPGGRIIDLSATSFSRLAPLSAGLVRVTVQEWP